MTVIINKPGFNLREALTSLKRKIGIKGAELMAAETVSDVYNVIGTNRNLLINGDFRISQRGTYTSATAFANYQYCLDRWWINSGPVFVTHQLNQVLPGSNVTNVLRYEYNGGTFMSIGQKVEDLTYQPARGKTVTLSAWVRTNMLNVGIRIYDGTQNYGKRHSGNGTWEKLTLTYTFPVSPGGCIPLVDHYYNGSYAAAASGSYIEFAQFQMEIGSAATPFEHRPYGTELALCQRYCQQFTSPEQVYFLTGHVWSTTLCQYTFLPKVQMRTHPTLESGGTIANLSGQSTVNLSGISLDGAGYFAEGQQVKINATMSSSSFTSGYSCALLLNSGGAYIRFNAEL